MVIEITQSMRETKALLRSTTLVFKVRVKAALTPHQKELWAKCKFAHSEGAVQQPANAQSHRLAFTTSLDSLVDNGVEFEHEDLRLVMQARDAAVEAYRGILGILQSAESFEKKYNLEL